MTEAVISKLNTAEPILVAGDIASAVSSYVTAHPDVLDRAFSVDVPVGDKSESRPVTGIRVSREAGVLLVASDSGVQTDHVTSAEVLAKLIHPVNHNLPVIITTGIDRGGFTAHTLTASPAEGIRFAA